MTLHGKSSCRNSYTLNYRRNIKDRMVYYIVKQFPWRGWAIRQRYFYTIIHISHTNSPSRSKKEACVLCFDMWINKIAVTTIWFKYIKIINFLWPRKSLKRKNLVNCFIVLGECSDILCDYFVLRARLILISIKTLYVMSTENAES